MNAGRSASVSSGRLACWGLLAALTSAAPAGDEAGFLEIRNGYFWDSKRQEYFVPRGIAYQLWNPPVGATQSFDQLAYDLLEFKKMYANSVRCELVWSQVEIAPGVYDWEKPDRLMAEAERLGLRLFILIGFQYPPPWFPKEWYAINANGLTPEALACLAGRPPAEALGCLPAITADCLRESVPSGRMGEVQQALVTGAQSGGLAGALDRLSSVLSPASLEEALRCLISDVLNYEHPEARAAYQQYIAAITGRYKDRPVIGAWILGNEYAYFDLWEDPARFPVRRFLGFDQYSQASFRNYLSAQYQGDIAALNAAWSTAYADFATVIMPSKYPEDRVHPGYHDLIQWRKKSVGDFVALGAVAARDADPNHLRTYSMVGGIFNGRDANNTCEDAETIVARCQAAGAPLDFWSLNNYANAALGSELRSAVFGITKYQDQSGLPVMISETGHSSTEDLFDYPDAGKRQPKAAPGQLWESLVAGAIGTHLFHWNDRSQFTANYFLRERGFGIVEQTRRPKQPVYENVRRAFQRMEEMRIERLLGGSLRPPPDVQFLWSVHSDMGWPRANQENAMMWGALKRLGYQLAILNDEAFERGGFTNAPALLLSRAYQLHPDQLEALGSRVLPAGTHLHANADLPGQFNAYHQPNPNWASQMDALFGIGAHNALPAVDAIVTNDFYSPITFTGTRSLGPVLTPGYSASVHTWKIWHGITATTGQTIATHSGYLSAAPGTPALVLKNHPAGHGAAAINTFALGDTYAAGGSPPAAMWEFRYDWLGAIYREHFGLTPALELVGAGAKHVLPDYRICANGSLLISLLNEHTNSASITLIAPALIEGKTIENLTDGGLVETSSTGAIEFVLEGDGFLLLYAYDRKEGRDESLLNPNPEKVWFLSAPPAVWPKGIPYEISIGTHLPEGADATLWVSFEQAGPPHHIYGLASAAGIAAGPGVHQLEVPVPDADLHDPEYRSTPEGGSYRWRAWLEQEGLRVSEAFLPARLLWGVRPLELPALVAPGLTYTVPVKWEELPSPDEGDPTPLSRAALWDSLSPPQHYNLVLELTGGSDNLLASVTNVISEGSGTHPFSITVPAGAQGPFFWQARLQSAPQTGALDLTDGFEGRDLGVDRSPIHPWYAYVYSPGGEATLLSEGVLIEPSRGAQAAFLSVTNPPSAGDPSGFGIIRGTPEGELPADPGLWSGLVFGCDFKETRGQECVIELQIKDAEGNWMQFTRPYAPGAGQWHRIQASLDQFVLPDGPGATFDPTRIRNLAVNIRMLRTGATYEAFFDNISFTGAPPIEDSFEDRPTGTAYSRIAPWIAYGYDEAQHNDVLLDHGVHHVEASEGSQSAFLIAWNRTDSGAWAGFGMLRPFDREWALPADRSQWRNHSISFDFKERSGRACLLELQLKNWDDPACPLLQRGIHFTKPYTPGPDGWDTITATLDQFTQPDYFCPFDPGAVALLVLNVQMLEQRPEENVIYESSFDNIRFRAPLEPGPGGAVFGAYTSASDSLRFTRIEFVLPEAIALSWVGGGMLLWADAPGGPWVELPGATSPLLLEARETMRFFRLRR